MIHKFKFIPLLSLVIWIPMIASAAELVKGWPEQVKTVKYPASIDKSEQPMLALTAKSKEKRPLLVGLHTWSGGYEQAGGEATYARWCMENDWHFIHPHFRGPNWTPDACGSDKVVQDIVDAVKYMSQHHNVDTNRIYLVGVSGGGYAALLLAARAPFTHSLYAYNQIVPERDRIDQKLIEEFYQTQTLPAGLDKADPDPLYGKKHVVFRKVSQNSRVTIFNGKHEIIHTAALNWLSQQRKNKPANWNVTAEHALKTNGNEGKSGK